MRKVATALTGSRRRDSLLGQAVRFGILTGVSASLSLGIPIALHEIVGISAELAVPIGFVIVFFVNFLALRSAVFVSQTGMLRDFVNFTGISALFRVGEYCMFLALYKLLDFYYAFALLIVLGLSSILKFFSYRTRIHGRAR